MSDEFVAKAVRSLRKALGYTQEEIAALGGVDRLLITHIETDRNKATSPPVRRALATAFGLSLDDVDKLLTGDLSTRDAIRRATRAVKPKPAGRAA